MGYLAAVVVVLLVVVLLIMLATMREVALLQEKVSIYKQLLLRPARPSYIGEQLPLPVIESLGKIAGLSTAERALLIFMRPDCSACQEMSVKLPSIATLLGPIKPIIVVGRGPRAHRMADRMASADLIAKADPDETLFDAAEIRSTPTMILVDMRNQVAEDYAEGSDMQWLTSLQPEFAPSSSPRSHPD